MTGEWYIEYRPNLPKQRVAGSSPVSRSRYDFGLVGNQIDHLVFGGLRPYFSEA